MLGSLFTLLFEYIRPVVVIYSSIGVIVSFLLGALLDPQGLMNQIIVEVIDNIASILPSTPDELKIGALVNDMGDAMPLVGRGIMQEIYDAICKITLIASIIKIYKLLPFKAT